MENRKTIDGAATEKSENCANCKQWSSLPNEKKVGERRRHPPVFRENTIVGEWPVTKDRAWRGEWNRGSAGGEGGAAPVAPSGMEVDVAQLGRPTSESMIVNRKAYEQLRSELAMERTRRVQLDETIERMAKRIAELEEDLKDWERTEKDLKNWNEQLDKKVKPAPRARKQK